MQVRMEAEHWIKKITFLLMNIKIEVSVKHVARTRRVELCFERENISFLFLLHITIYIYIYTWDLQHDEGKNV